MLNIYMQVILLDFYYKFKSLFEFFSHTTQPITRYQAYKKSKKKIHFVAKITQEIFVLFKN